MVYDANVILIGLVSQFYNDFVFRLALFRCKLELKMGT